jgi:hypothetical protein
MARKRLSMRKIKEVLRLKHAGGLSTRAIARACSIGKETVREYLCRAQEAGIGWPLPDGLDDEELERRLFASVLKSINERSCPDWALVHQELRKKGVTRQLLWREYKEEDPDFLGYSQFCERYNRILCMKGKSVSYVESPNSTWARMGPKGYAHGQGYRKSGKRSNDFGFGVCP